MPVAARRLLNHRGEPILPAAARAYAQARAQVPLRDLGANVQAAYDAAQTTPENAAHWRWVDGLSAAAANSPEVRKILRERARYEIDNNPDAGAIVWDFAEDVVGTGPRLQWRGPDPVENKLIELLWRRWAFAVQLPAKLATFFAAEIGDGEGVLLLTDNPKLEEETGLTLDVTPLECDQLSSPHLASDDERAAVDGIEFDAYGNPAFYHLLKTHPGGLGGGSDDFDRIPAEDLVHFFKMRRAKQRRGVPRILASLPLFAQLRRYGLAVLATAEIAASLAGFMYTDSTAINPEDVDNIALDEGLPIERGQVGVLPHGHKFAQVRAEQPTTTHGEFSANVLTRAGRPLRTSRGRATGDSSGYNYASARMDDGGYRSAVGHYWSRAERAVMWPILRRFWAEAKAAGKLPPKAAAGGLHCELVDWQRDGFTPTDPAKEQRAGSEAVAAGNSRRGLLYAAAGLDVDAEDERAAAEFGVSLKQYRQALFHKTFKIPQAPVVVAGDDDDKSDDDAEGDDA